MLRLSRLRAALASLSYFDSWTMPKDLSRTMLRSMGSLRPVSSPVGTVLHPYAPPIGGKGYGRYLRGLKRVHAGERVPLVAHLAVTDRCGYACARCSNLPSGREPSLAELKSVIASLRARGTACVAFTGGEPTLREDLPEIVRACGDMSTLLFTNGEKLDPSLARRLGKAGLELVFVSLDHYRPERHDVIRGKRGAFDQACAAIKASFDAGLYTAIQTVVESDLLAEPEMTRFLAFCKNLGVHEVMLLEPVSVKRPGVQVPPSTRQTLSDWHRRALIEAGLPKVTVMSFLEAPGFLGCQAGFTFLYVNTAGEVFPCDFVPTSLGNIHQDGIDAVLARTGKYITGPSCRCMAECLNEKLPQDQRPLAGKASEGFFRDYDPGPAPGLMDWLAPPAQRKTG